MFYFMFLILDVDAFAGCVLQPKSRPPQYFSQMVQAQVPPMPQQRKFLNGMEDESWNNWKSQNTPTVIPCIFYKVALDKTL
mmetsp:Transcript_26219/g.38981  ORF Transcript_26219/g.38981 Transcript_26219/m.38981 type:complete len:81 (-) Transcript_26219:1007-1249(-)